MTECFWCDTFYNSDEMNKCPNCQSKTSTGVITLPIIVDDSVMDDKNWKYTRGFIQRICIHGVGHPDLDDPSSDPLHTCDGCCVSEAP